MGNEKKLLIQKSLFQSLNDLLPENQSLVAELADLLDVSIDSIYRRMRGETSMTVDELAIVCSKFKLSFDALINLQSEVVTFNYKVIHSSADFKIYLEAILNDLKLMRKTENQHVTYSAVDVPIFHYFRFPELTAFKMFYWLRTVVQDPNLQNLKYDQSLVSEDVKTLAKELHHYYSMVPSTEIWTDDTINSLVKQIDYSWESGIFSTKDDALLICNQTEGVIEFLKKQADASSKHLSDDDQVLTDNNYKLYFSDIEFANNCIQIVFGNNCGTYLSHMTFNKIFTANKPFNDATREWMDNLIRKSTLISGVAEKTRYQFIQRNLDKLNKVRNKIIES